MSGPDKRRRRALVIAAAGYFFVLLDVTIINVALVDISSGLGASRASLQWVVDAYALVLAASMLGAGDLADRAGAARVFSIGLAVFGLASAACAVAPSAALLIAFRAAQGAGAAAILPTSLALVNRLYPDPGERPAAIGIWAGVGGTALVAGPVLGGLLVEAGGWRLIFWLNVPLAAIALALALRALPADPPRSARSSDLAGQALGTAGLASLVFLLIEGGRSGFGSAPALLALGVTLIASAGFLARELHADEPMLHLGWFGNRLFSSANLGAGLMNLGTLGALFTIGVYLQERQGLSALDAGLCLLPLAAPLALLTPFTGRLVSSIGPRLPAGAGLLAGGVGYGGVALLGGPALDSAGGFALLALAGAGMGIAVPGLVAGATEALGAERAGIAAAINNTCRQVGGAIGVAAIGSLASFTAALCLSSAALLLGGGAALALMGRRSG